MKKGDNSEDDKTGVIRLAIYRVGVGAVGSLLLVFFLMGLMSISRAVSWMPWIVGFNAALTGYTLLDKTRGRLKRKRAAALGSGALMALAACLGLHIAGLYLSGGPLLSAADLIFFTLIGTVCSGLGAWLAIRYLNL